MNKVSISTDSNGENVSVQLDGKPIEHLVATADISFSPQKIPTVTLGLFMFGPCEVSGEPKYTVIDPRDGEQRGVAEIRFADGSVWQAQ